MYVMILWSYAVWLCFDVQVALTQSRFGCLLSEDHDHEREGPPVAVGDRSHGAGGRAVREAETTWRLQELRLECFGIAQLDAPNLEPCPGYYLLHCCL